MTLLPKADIAENTYEYETQAKVKATGFREYDARWVSASAPISTSAA